MNFTSDQIAAIIGAKELELVSLRMQLAQALAKIKELEPKPVEQPATDNVVSIKEPTDGAA